MKEYKLHVRCWREFEVDELPSGDLSGSYDARLFVAEVRVAASTPLLAETLLQRALQRLVDEEVAS